jgi:hypothetical protein
VSGEWCTGPHGVRRSLGGSKNSASSAPSCKGGKEDGRLMNQNRPEGRKAVFFQHVEKISNPFHRCSQSSLFQESKCALQALISVYLSGGIS